MKRLSWFGILLFLLQITSQSYGQVTRANSDNTNAWLMYFGNHKLSDRIGIHAEIQLRRNEWFSASQQLLLRTGLDYYTKGGNRFTVGYAYVETHPYGDFPVANAFPEHRIWQQFLTSQTIGKVKLSHRYRLEQRMIGNASTGEIKNGRYENRFRYMAKATVNLTSGDHALFLAAYDEVFVNFGREVAYNIFDQNRLYGAIGITLSPHVKLELGYLNQIVQLRSLDSNTGVSRNKIENNHTLQIGLFCSLPLYNKKND
jgi:hypothetical protein